MYEHEQMNTVANSLTPYTSLKMEFLTCLLPTTRPSVDTLGSQIGRRRSPDRTGITDPNTRLFIERNAARRGRRGGAFARLGRGVSEPPGPGFAYAR